MAKDKEEEPQAPQTGSTVRSPGEEEALAAAEDPPKAEDKKD